MNAYSALARWYDRLTKDVPYKALADFYEKLMLGGRIEHPDSLIDLCCGTATLTYKLAQRGYEMVGVDSSAEMLCMAKVKGDWAKDAVRPLFICQDAAHLDLIDRADGGYCSLDGMNYIKPNHVGRVFARLNSFLAPGAVFAFDFHSPEHLRALDNDIYLDEQEGLFCLWRGNFEEKTQRLVYDMDIFRCRPTVDEYWARQHERHIEYAHTPEFLRQCMEAHDFTDVELITDGPQHEMGRLYMRGVNNVYGLREI